MSDIVERLWEYGTVVGTPLSAQDRVCHQAADEIERLRGLLREARQRTQNLLHRQHGDAIIMNPDEYLRATLSWLDDALAESGHESGQNGPSAADQPDAGPRVKRAYYETHEPPHCPTCECGATAQPDALRVNCARCGLAGTSETFYIEEGDEWECPACWERCEAAERTADNAAAQPAAAPCGECGGTRHLFNGTTRVDCDVCEGTGTVPPVHQPAATLECAHDGNCTFWETATMSGILCHVCGKNFDIHTYSAADNSGAAT